MPSQMYQSKKFRRSKYRYSRLIRRSFCLIGLIALYFAITVGLDHSDETPRWAHVSFPPFVVKSDSHTVDVAYRGLGENASINAGMKVNGPNGSPMVDLEAPEGSTAGPGRGRVSFKFGAIDPNGLMDFNDLSAQFSVSCKDGTGSFPSIKSGRITVLPSDHERVTLFKNQPAYQNVLINAFKYGHWAGKNWGDHTVVGWGITVLYLLAGLLCFYCTGPMDSRRALPISQIFAWFWCFMGVAVILFGINKQLDIQMLMADIGREYTKYHGWYLQRKPFQIRIMALGACVGLACVQGLAYRMRGGPKSIKFALWGLFFLSVNVLMHMVSLHAIHRVMAFSVAGLSVSSGLEILAICWIAVSAWIFNRTEREEVSYIMQ